MKFIIIYPPPSTIAKEVPLGALYLADALIKENYLPIILDNEIEDIKTNIIKHSDKDTLAFGISSLSGTQLKNSITIAKFLRENYPDKPIIWGGAHVTALPSDTLESNLVDYIVWGEGEKSLPKLLYAIQNGKDFHQIDGIGFKMGKEKVVTKNSGYTKLENKIFSLPYNLLDMEKYKRKMNIGLDRCFYIFSSRGCPFNCKFCSNSSKIWANNRVRYHSIEHITNDIKTLVNKYNADGITFGDELFFINEKRVIEICNEINKLNLNIKFRGSGRADLLSRLKDTTWQLLKDTGFVGIGMGIESGSQRMLDYMGKKTTLEQIYKTDEKLTEYHFFKTYNFMTCLPGESIDDLKETLKVILDLAKTSYYCPYPFSTLHKYIPLPGTELYEISKEYGFIPPISIDGWTDFDFENVYDTTEKVRPWLSGEMLKYVNRVNDLVEKLNGLYMGENANKTKIKSVMNEISEMI